RYIFTFGDATTPVKQPYTWQWNVGIEQALGASQSLTVSYLGASGRRLLSFDTRNLAALNPNFTTVTVVGNRLTSSYNALQVQFHRKLSPGFQALASYTWSHSIDYGSNNATLPVKWGDSDFDVRHNFSAGATYVIPAPFKHAAARALLRHWSLDGRFSARS